MCGGLANKCAIYDLAYEQDDFLVPSWRQSNGVIQNLFLFENDPPPNLVTNGAINADPKPSRQIGGKQ